MSPDEYMSVLPCCLYIFVFRCMSIRHFVMVKNNIFDSCWWAKIPIDFYDVVLTDDGLQS